MEFSNSCRSKSLVAKENLLEFTSFEASIIPILIGRFTFSSSLVKLEQLLTVLTIIYHFHVPLN